MKKLLTLFLAVTLSLSFSACAPKDNPYVQSAKKHGYWYGFGGVSWGMTINDCAEALDATLVEYSEEKSRDEYEKNREVFTRVEENISNDKSKTTSLIYCTDVFGKPAVIQFVFFQNAPFVENMEFLHSAMVTYDMENPSPMLELMSEIEKELSSLELEYEKDSSHFSNKKSLDNLPDSEAKTKAITYYQQRLDKQVDKTETFSFAQTFILDDILPMPFKTIDGVETSFTIKYSGMNAAYLALAEMGRTP